MFRGINEPMLMFYHTFFHDACRESCVESFIELRVKNVYVVHTRWGNRPALREGLGWRPLYYHYTTPLRSLLLEQSREKTTRWQGELVLVEDMLDGNGICFCKVAHLLFCLCDSGFRSFCLQKARDKRCYFLRA